MRPITHIVIHCSATPDGKPVGIEEIDRMHRARGFHRVGYHYVIEVDGALMTGRPVEEVGAHVQGNNAKSIGVCMVGTARFAAEQWEVLAGLVAELEARFPAAAICGHRDYSPDLDGDGVLEEHEWFKICPGFDVAEWLRSGRSAMWHPAHLLGGSP